MSFFATIIAGLFLVICNCENLTLFIITKLIGIMLIYASKFLFSRTQREYLNNITTH